MGWRWLSVRWRESYRKRSFPLLTQGGTRPCGMNNPHTHPRASEFLYVVSDGQLEAGFIEESGARIVVNTLTQGQGTVFPKGSIHFQVNLGCEPLTFVAALDDEDPGVSQIAQRCKAIRISFFSFFFERLMPGCLFVNSLWFVA
jgi:mannose-6-phosphate isomerase-like protein (cupin superfamily)